MDNPQGVSPMFASIRSKNTLQLHTVLESVTETMNLTHVVGESTEADRAMRRFLERLHKQIEFSIGTAVQIAAHVAR